MISEAVVLRRELHEVLAKLEDSRNVNECILVALKSTRLEAAESKVGWDKSEEENGRVEAGERRAESAAKAGRRVGFRNPVPAEMRAAAGEVRQA